MRRSDRKAHYRKPKAQMHGDTICVALRPVGCSRMEVRVFGRWFNVGGPA